MTKDEKQLDSGSGVAWHGPQEISDEDWLAIAPAGGMVKQASQGKCSAFEGGNEAAI